MEESVLLGTKPLVDSNKIHIFSPPCNILYIFNSAGKIKDSAGWNDWIIHESAKYEIQKPSTCRATLFRCKFWVDISHFSPRVINLSRNKNICCGLKKCSALIGWFAWCGSKTSCEFDEKQATKSKFVAQSRPVLYFSQQVSSTRNKCFCRATSWSRKVKKPKHRLKTCRKTMLREKLRVFISLISPPLCLL